VNATIEDTGEHAVLQYGRHSAGVESDRPEDLRRGKHEIGSRSVFPDEELTVSMLLTRLYQDQIVDAAKPLDKTPITEVVQVAPPFWDTDTPEGILLKPRYPVGPPKREMHDPDATVGFLPLPDPAPPVTQDGNGPDERAYWDDGDPEPLDHTRYDQPPVGQEDYFRDPEWAHGRRMFAPIDTRVKKVPLWKQAIAGWKKPGWRGLP